MAEDPRFGGISRLYGRLGLERLKAARVCVVGVGGVGSWTVEGLVRSGVGALTMIDLDEVCVTNTNRQLPALEGNVGRAKVVALAERAHAIAPDCRVEAVQEFFTAASEDRLLGERYDWVVDAIDQVEQKCQLIAGCRRRGIPVLTVGGAGGKRDGTAVRVADLAESHRDPLLKRTRQGLRAEHGFPREPGVLFGVPCVFSAESPVYPHSDGTSCRVAEPGVSLRLDCASGFGAASFVTGAFGLAAAGEVVRAIAVGREEGR
jgi:tRNA A37 threonylcarbamoyladenosine dehydratase